MEYCGNTSRPRLSGTLTCRGPPTPGKEEISRLRCSLRSSQSNLATVKIGWIPFTYVSALTDAHRKKE